MTILALTSGSMIDCRKCTSGGRATNCFATICRIHQFASTLPLSKAEAKVCTSSLSCSETFGTTPRGWYCVDARSQIKLNMIPVAQGDKTDLLWEADLGLADMHAANFLGKVRDIID